MLSVTIGNYFPEVWEILPSAFGVEQYFPRWPVWKRKSW